MTPNERPVLSPEQERLDLLRARVDPSSGDDICERGGIFWDDIRFLLAALAAKDAELARVMEEREDLQSRLDLQCQDNIHLINDARQRIDQIAKLTSEVLHERDKLEAMARRADRFLARAESAEAEASGKRPKTRWITKGLDSVEVSVDPEQACCEIHPDASGRRCMKPKGHSGSHWTSAEPAPAEASPQRAPKP